MPIIYLGGLYLALAWFVGWWPFELRTSGSLPLSKYEDVHVNAYFYYPNDKEAYLGEMKGASACGAAAHSYARREEISGDWGYICCTIRNGSSCYEKIR